MASQKSVWRALDRAYKAAGADPWQLDPVTAKYVLFSDHHKGKRDGADDFVRSEKAYHAALGYYQATGYTLFVLGDVEELWECRAKDVIPVYRQTLELEATFHQKQRYVRFFGNHDDQWEKQSSFEKHLGSLFPGLKIREGLRLQIARGGDTVELFLVHGHQGTTGSDKLRWLAKPVVRYIWRPFQRLTGARLNTPATSFTLRGEHNRAMYEWAQGKHGLVLIAGHTHKPVFLGRSEAARVRAEIAQLEAESPQNRQQIAEAHAELAWLETIERTEGVAGAKLCYFNTGCCSFDDGDVTGIEIADGEICLVRWPDDDGKPKKKVLRRASLSEVLGQFAPRPNSGLL
jgi:UDP-2,3-diacylglucosamine pyrophosphatase LpxH